MTATQGVGTGPAGPAGTNGTPGVGANWRGVWSSATTYAVGDGVYRNNVPYISNAASNLNHDPATDNGTNWGSVNAALIDTLTTTVTPEKYGAKGDGKIVYDGAITSGQATLTSGASAFTSADAGKSVYVHGAGAAGAPLVTTILSVAGGVATLNASAGTTVSNATVISGTDDTAALQSAIDALYPTGGRLLGRNVIYVIAGALKTAATAGNNTGGLTYRSQLTLPAVNYFTPANAVTIEIAGPLPTHASVEHVPTFVSLLTGLTAPDDIAAQAKGWAKLPSMLGGPVNLDFNSSTAWSNIRVVLTNVRFMCPPNPSISAVNLQKVLYHDVRGCQFSTVLIGSGATVAACTNPSAMGLVGSTKLNFSNCIVDSTAIYGFYGGLVIPEHGAGTQIEINNCVVPLVLAPIDHGCFFGYVSCQGDNYGISYVEPSTGVASTAVNSAFATDGSKGAPLNIGMLDFEERDTPFKIVVHVNDPVNVVTGQISYLRIKGYSPGTGMIHTAWKTIGGKRIRATQIAASNIYNDVPGRFGGGDLVGEAARPQVQWVSGWAPGLRVANSIKTLTPTAYWRLGFADIGGTTLKDENNSFNGTYAGTYALGAPTPLMDNAEAAALLTGGNVGAAGVRFFGADGYGSIPDAAALDPAGAFTLMAFFQVFDWGTRQHIAGKFTASGSQGYALQVNAGSLVALINGGGWGVNTSRAFWTGPTPIGTWILAAMVYDGANLSLFTDRPNNAGNVSSTGLAVAGPAATALPFTIGGNVDAGMFLDGTVSEVAYWNGTALTRAQFDTIAASIRGQVSFFGAKGAGQSTIAGSRGGNAALASLLTALANFGLIIDGTSA